MHTHDTTICGIPALVKVYGFERPDPGDRETPPVPGGYDIEVCDQRGRPAKWLEAKMTERDWVELREELA